MQSYLERLAPPPHCAWFPSGTSKLSWQQYSTAWRYHILLSVHPLRDTGVVSSFWCYKQSSCEHPCTSFWVNVFSFFWDKRQKMPLLSHTVSLFLVLKKTVKLFSRVAVWFSIPTSNVQVTWFTAPLLTFGVIIKNFNHPDVCVVIPLYDIKSVLTQKPTMYIFLCPYLLAVHPFLLQHSSCILSIF